MPEPLLHLQLAPSRRLAAAIGAMHLTAWAGLATCAVPAGLLALAALALAGQAFRVMRRDALGAGPHAPTAVWLKLSGEAALCLGAAPPLPARVSACAVHLPGLVVVQLRTSRGRIGLLLTRGRVGAAPWRRLQVMARWAWRHRSAFTDC